MQDLYKELNQLRQQMSSREAESQPRNEYVYRKQRSQYESQLSESQPSSKYSERWREPALVDNFTTEKEYEIPKADLKKFDKYSKADESARQGQNRERAITAKEKTGRATQNNLPPENPQPSKSNRGQVFQSSPNLLVWEDAGEPERSGQQSRTAKKSSHITDSK